MRGTDKIASPKGNNVASIELGVNMLGTVTLNDGTVVPYLALP
ncbi:hypothetical protein [Metallosphaera tengchongensis]|nr:hypothetical protein [Metallosphaera tengchongensis]